MPKRGKDPREQLELNYRQKKDLTDLKNLVSYLKTVDDRAALRPLIRDLFDRERNVDNAKDLVNCFSGASFYDYAAIIRLLEDNPDILERSNDLRAAKARALFQAGAASGLKGKQRHSTEPKDKPGAIFISILILRLPLVTGNEYRQS